MKNCDCNSPYFDTGLDELLGFVEKDHRKMLHRDAEDSHPIGAITGLEEALSETGGFTVAYPLSDRIELGPTWLSLEEDGEPLEPKSGILYCLGADSISYPTNALFRWDIETYMPVVADSGFQSEIEDPSDRDVLLYDEESEKWKNYKLVDDNSLIYLNENGGLSIKHYEDARQGQMLVKDEREGLYWVDPVSDASLQEAVQQARSSAIQASASATQSGNFAADAIQAAVRAETTAQQVDNKFWYGTMEEYNNLETVSQSTIYVILDA